MKIYPTKQFTKNLKRMTKPEQKQIKAKIEIMQKDIKHPSLRTKKFKTVDGLFESSVNMDIRLIWIYVKDGVLLLKCVHHDELHKI